MTSNMVNCLVAGKKIFMADPFNATLKADVKKKVPAGVFIDVWQYHISAGEIHCATNAKRTVKDKDWWNK